MRLAPILALLLAGCVFDLEKRLRPGDGATVDLAYDQAQPPPPDGQRSEQPGLDAAPDRAEARPGDQDGIPDFMDPDPDLDNTPYLAANPPTIAQTRAPTPWKDDARGLCVKASGLAKVPLQLPGAGNDYAVAAKLTFYGDPLGNWPWAGIGLRGPSGYYCMVRIDKRQVQLLATSGGPQNDKQGPAKAPGDTFELRASADGESGKCGEVNQVPLTTTFGGTGGVALLASDVEVCFHYLVVASLPPPT